MIIEPNQDTGEIKYRFIGTDEEENEVLNANDQRLQIEDSEWIELDEDQMEQFATRKWDTSSSSLILEYDQTAHDEWVDKQNSSSTAETQTDSTNTDNTNGN